MVSGLPAAAGIDVAARRGNGGFQVVAQREFAAGEVVLEVAGVVTAVPRRYSLQVGDGEHVDVPPGLDPETQRRHYVWSYLDHACEPNAMFRGRRLVAIRAIQSGEVVTFHYATTEWEMAEPFACHCGSARCAGVVSGFRALPAAERERLRGWLAPHLLARFDAV